MLIARRLYQHDPNHKLGTLVDYKHIHHDGVFHRALADSEMTARLWLAMIDDIKHQYGVEDVSFGLMQKFAKTPKANINKLFS